MEQDRIVVLMHGGTVAVAGGNATNGRSRTNTAGRP